MPLRACMEAHTHREYKAWQAWLNMEMNKPTNDQYYMMRIAQRVQQANVKHPNKISLKDQLVSFIMGKKQQPKKLSKEEQVKQSKSRWFGLLGISKDKR